MDLGSLIQKYSVSGPRYTSYPTAPQFHEGVGTETYRRILKNGFDQDNEPLALYIHLPFCEALCYYCGCNIQITKDHMRSKSYVEALLQEMQEVAALLGTKRQLSQIAWGGGTPTFLSVEEMTTLHKTTVEHFELVEGAEVSIEIDPRVTTDEQLKALRELGFNRVSLGVQDFDPKVQEVIHRIQPAYVTKRMLRFCRELGFTGINFDLIYGMPLQTFDTFSRTVDEVIRMQPDRIALYNYAHLPSLRPHQKILEAHPMPDADTRVKIFEYAYQAFISQGYKSTGMDHFALETDELFKSLEKGTLYRNFQGYTVKRGVGLIGLGASAIGEVGDTYFQNLRGAKEYEEAIASKKLATFRGIEISDKDLERKWIIQSLMCNFQLSYAAFREKFGVDFKTRYQGELKKLDEFVADDLLALLDEKLQVTELGRVFIRNIAMVFDSYLNGEKTATYSKTV